MRTFEFVPQMDILAICGTDSNIRICPTNGHTSHCGTIYNVRMRPTNTYATSTSTSTSTATSTMIINQSQGVKQSTNFKVRKVIKVKVSNKPFIFFHLRWVLRSVCSLSKYAIFLFVVSLKKS